MKKIYEKMIMKNLNKSKLRGYIGKYCSACTFTEQFARSNMIRPFMHTLQFQNMYYLVNDLNAYTPINFTALNSAKITV